MKIKKAAEMCQMTPRNIRFYEEVGLIQATRVDNGYRDYGKKDIERLQQIRTLRNLGIRIDSIKAYFKKEKTFYQIIQERKQELNRQRKDMDAIYQMCEQLENQKLPLSSSVTNLIEDTLQEKRYRSKKPVYGRLLSSNVKNRLSRRAVLINSIAGLLIFFVLGYLFLGNLLNTLFKNSGNFSQPMINSLIFILVLILTFLMSVYMCKTTYFELREDGIYYLDKQSPCSSWDLFIHILKTIIYHVWNLYLLMIWWRSKWMHRPKV